MEPEPQIGRCRWHPWQVKKPASPAPLRPLRFQPPHLSLLHVEQLREVVFVDVEVVAAQALFFESRFGLATALGADFRFGLQ